MIGLMRKLINNNAYRVILWIFLFMMAAGSGLLINIGHEKKWVIKAYDEIVSQKRFDTVLKAARYQQEEYRRRNIFIGGKNINKEAVDSAISGVLVEHVMSSLHFTVPNYVMEQSFHQILGQLPKHFFTPNGDLNEVAFARLIAPQTIDDFLDGLQLESKSSLLYSIVDLSSYACGFELQLMRAVEFAKKDYSIIKLPLQRYVAKTKEKNLPDEALEKFYKKTKVSEEFKTQEKRAGLLWRFTQSAYNPVVSESDIKKQYEKDKNKYLITPSEMQLRVLLVKNEPSNQDQARERIESLHEKAQKDPDTFETLVKEFSDDKSAAKHGGLTELFSQDDAKMDQLVVKTAFEGLIKDGQVSAPLKTDKGYELVQRVKKIPAKYKELKSVSDEIKKEIAANKFKQRFQQDAQRVISQVKYSPEGVKNFIDRYKGISSTISLGVKKSGVEMVNLFKTDEQRYAVFFDNNEGYILQCTEIEKSKVPPLKDVRNEVLNRYYQQEAAQLLEADLSKALQSLRTSDDMDSVAKEYGVKLEKASFAYKNEKVEESPILKDGEIKPKLKTLSHKGAVTSVITQHDGLLIRLDSIEDDVEQEFKEKERYGKALGYAKKYKVKEGFIASLYRRATLDNKIEMKPEVLQLLKEA